MVPVPVVDAAPRTSGSQASRRGIVWIAVGGPTGRDSIGRRPRLRPAGCVPSD
jgi:hypothetical protein